MPRITVTLTDEAKAWVEAEAEARDINQSDVIAECVDDVRGAASAESLSRRVAELEERVADLERGHTTAVQAGADDRTDVVQAEPDTEPPSTSPVQSDDDLSAALNAIEELTWVEAPRAGRETALEALRAVVRYIDQQDGAQAADIREKVFPKHPAGWPDDKALNWWRNFVVERLGELRDQHGVVHTEGSGRYTTWHLGPE